MRLIAFIFILFGLCYTQTNINQMNLHHGLTERIGNFSIEVLYHTTTMQKQVENLVMSPFTLWTVLAVIAEGASGETLKQISRAIRVSPKLRAKTREDFRNIAQWLLVNTSTVDLEKFNAIFVDEKKLPLNDFVSIANQYDTKLVKLNFTGSKTSELINRAIDNVTHGKIPNLTDPGDFGETQMILTSALYFKGQWTVPFNKSSTTKQPFYDSHSKKIGEVNMMYNRHNYPFANILELNARVIEIPYGKENRLSMLIMLPNPGFSLQDMFLNFNKVPLDTIFENLKLSTDEYGDEEVDCLIPRFKIESSLDLTEMLKRQLNIRDLFDESKVSLPFMSRIPMYVTKVTHKAAIEVTEEGTEAAAITAAEFTNRIGVVRFEANRPFCYLIIEKTTNSIVFGGFYQYPSLF
ncbi:serine protease inhibitor 77Ba [Papilio machaon]|uniref:serine protease inhibitor 77Ba n=1 Tax=Papilio machaon TaxID=76193 RepID=UPI001E662A4B|nr:serine protease inhibitor 77Ba [Papilio machaon]